MGSALFTNNASSTLAAPITAIATTLTVATGDGAKFPTITGSDYFYTTLNKVVSGIESQWEVVKVTARATDVFTLLRAQDNTTAAAFATGDLVSLRVPATVMGAYEAVVHASQTANSIFAAPNGSAGAATYRALVAADVPTTLSANTTAAGLMGSSSAAVTAAGTNQASATALTSDTNVVTTVTAASGVVLPNATSGKYAIVVNRGANSLLVYPAPGHAFDGYAVNGALTLPVNGLIELYAVSGSLWYTTLQATTQSAMLQGTVATANGGTALTATPTNGQIPIGNGSGYTLATLTAGTGIAVVNTAGVVTISASGGTVPAGATIYTAQNFGGF